jgi:hypothetical protein
LIVWSRFKTRWLNWKSACLFEADSKHADWIENRLVCLKPI